MRHLRSLDGRALAGGPREPRGERTAPTAAPLDRSLSTDRDESTHRDAASEHLAHAEPLDPKPRGWSSEAIAVLRAHVAGAAAPRSTEAAQAQASQLRALRHHDGLALIAEERRALHTLRVLVGEMMPHAIAAAWPATSDEQRLELQREARELVAAIGDHVESASFRGLTLLDGSCTMVGIQAAPGSTEFLVLALRDLRTSELGLHAIDLTSLTGAKMARVALRQALDTLAATEELLVHDLHELLAGRAASS